MGRTLRLAIVAGEASGDILGADLLAALKRQYPAIHCEGIGGPLMQAQGFVSLFPMERLSVMGLVEPLKRLPELLRIRRQLRQRWLAQPPDLMLGIDSPDFNLDLELSLREAGVTTAHYVSPSVWAWRQGRIKKIARAVDHMLTLLPFEADFYRQHQVPVTFVGHPLADQIPLHTDSDAARTALQIDLRRPCIALLPGSRGGEVGLLGEIFLQTAQWCLARQPDLQFLLPAANPQRYEQLQAMLAGMPALPVQLLQGQSHQAMAAADVVLMASGTTTLEALLLKKPMVVAYKMAPLSYAIISRLVKTPYISLPNLLAGEALVPEVLQADVTPQRLGELLLARLQGDNGLLLQRFTAIHQQLRCGAGDQAARTLLGLVPGLAVAPGGGHDD